jgi:hypothetical protein
VKLVKANKISSTHVESVLAEIASEAPETLSAVAIAFVRKNGSVRLIQGHEGGKDFHALIGALEELKCRMLVEQMKE